MPPMQIGKAIAAEVVENKSTEEMSLLPPLPLPSALGSADTATKTAVAKAKPRKRKGHRGGKKAAEKKAARKSQKDSKNSNNSGDEIIQPKGVKSTIDAADMHEPCSSENSSHSLEIKEDGAELLPRRKETLLNAVDKGNERDPRIQAGEDIGPEITTFVEGMNGDEETVPATDMQIDTALYINSITLVEANPGEDVPGDANAIGDANAAKFAEQNGDKGKEKSETDVSVVEHGIEKDTDDDDGTLENAECKSEALVAVDLGEGCSPTTFESARRTSISTPDEESEDPIESDAEHEEILNTSQEVTKILLPTIIATSPSIPIRTCEETSASPTDSDSPIPSSPTSLSSSCTNISLEPTIDPVCEGLFELRPSPGKGFGLFATALISKGTRILSESPILVLPAMDSICIAPTVAALSSSQQADFFALSHPQDSERDEELSDFLEIIEENRPIEERNKLSIKEQVAAHEIVRANSHAILDEQGQKSGIFALAARINHSCLPNVYHAWNSTLQRLTVHAIRDLQPGEELLTTYIPLCLPRATRNGPEHLGRYGFTCACRSCNGTTGWSRRSEKRRVKMEILARSLDEHWVKSGISEERTAGTESDEGAYRVAKDLLILLEKEGIANMEIVRCCHLAGELAGVAGEFDEAFELSRRALAVTEICTGSDSLYSWNMKG